MLVLIIPIVTVLYCLWSNAIISTSMICQIIKLIHTELNYCYVCKDHFLRSVDDIGKVKGQYYKLQKTLHPANQLICILYLDVFKYKNKYLTKKYDN